MEEKHGIIPLQVTGLRVHFNNWLSALCADAPRDDISDYIFDRFLSSAWFFMRLTGLHSPDSSVIQPKYPEDEGPW